MLTLSIHPDWPYIVALAFIGACLYARLVVMLNNDMRAGRYWQNHSWVEVVFGISLMSVTAGFIAGWAAMAGILAMAVVWGAPMIVAVLVTNARRQAERDEQADATR